MHVACPHCRSPIELVGDEAPAATEREVVERDAPAESTPRGPR
jgi:hypothetical protein